MLYQGRTSGRAGIGLDSSGQVSLVKLQPFLDISAVFQRLAADTRVTSTLAAIMHDHPVLMPEKCKLNYKQRLADGGEHFGLGEVPTAPAAATRGGSDLGRFPIHNDYACLLRSTRLETPGEEQQQLDAQFICLALTPTIVEPRRYYRKQRCPPTALTSCIVIDDCTLENGPLRMWPGTHKHHLEHDPHELGLQVRPELLADGTLDAAGGQPVLAKAGSFIVFQVTTIHASTPNFTANPRRLCIFAHCPESLFVPQLHPGNQNAVIREGAFETSYLRSVVIGTATPLARL